MFYLFREVNLQGGFFVTFVLLASDRMLHPPIVRKCKRRYDSCMYLSSCNPKCFFMNPECAVKAPGGTFFFFEK